VVDFRKKLAHEAPGETADLPDDRQLTPGPMALYRIHPFFA
jgi:hypothetical protein